MGNRLEEDVVQLIRSSDIQDRVVDLAEAGFDQLLQDGFLREVPVLGTVVGFIRAAGSVRDLLLAKKLGRFLLELQKVPIEERRAFDDSLASRDERRRVGEALLLLLDRLDDLDKPELVARVFRASMRGEVDRTTFQLMGSAIDRLHLPHLARLISFYDGDTARPSNRVSDRDLLQALSLTGLVAVEACGDGGGMFDSSMAGATLSYRPNALGKQFVDIIARDA